MIPTPEPARSTTPTSSWPGWYGRGTQGCRPWAAWTSEPQMPATSRRTSAFPAPGTGSGTTSIPISPVAPTTTWRVPLLLILEPSVPVPVPQSRSAIDRIQGDPSEQALGVRSVEVALPRPQSVGRSRRARAAGSLRGRMASCQGSDESAQ